MERKNIIVLMISLSLVLLLGSSYALLRSTKVGSNPYVINVGTLQVTFDSGKTEKINLENMYPMSDKEGSGQSDVLAFTVKNTGTVASYYDITLEETSTNPEFKSVIRFISNKDNQGYNEPKTLSEDKYIDVGGYLESNASSSYKVKVWLDYNADNTYMDKTFTAKVVVNSFQESSYAKDVIKSKLVKYEESSKEDFTGGLIAVNMDGDLYNETDASQEIREYRYSGPTVNNYVTFNDEMWRIVGVFKDEIGEESVKIVRNETLTGIFPETYKISDTVFNIRGKSDDTVYWNRNEKNVNVTNWYLSGLQYWLNSKQDDNGEKGYLSHLTNVAENMIKNINYYLGNVTSILENGSYFIPDTAKEAYVNERTVNGCSNLEDGTKVGVTTNTKKEEIENNKSCRVYANYSAIWKGKIGLLYPSDYGFTVRNATNNWNKRLVSYSDDIVKNSSWLHLTTNHNSKQEWLLSPTTINNDSAPCWHSIGSIYNNSIGNNTNSIRPTLYLKSNVKITSGNGTEQQPYLLSVQ